MKRALLFFFAAMISAIMSAQFVAKVEMKKAVSGICDKDEVYAPFPGFDGQEEAKCPLTEEEILKKLNEEVTFLKDNPKYKDEGMVSIYINCKGEMVQCQMDGNNKTKNPELDKQIEAVFNSLGAWKAGKINGKDVDTSWLFSFKIKNGKFVKA